MGRWLVRCNKLGYRRNEEMKAEIKGNDLRLNRKGAAAATLAGPT